MRDRELAFKSLFRKGFEWVGELGFFGARVFRAAVAPPYELGELLRQCDIIGAKSLPLVAAGRSGNRGRALAANS